MKIIEVREQVRPPLKRCAELVLSGIKYRLFRASVTVVIIALAVAFLMTMLSESLITRRVAEAIEVQTAPRRLLQYWVARLSTVPDTRQFNDILASVPKGSDGWLELAAWGNLTDDQLSRLVDVAKRQQVYMAFLDGLSEGKRRVLADRARGEEILALFVDKSGSDSRSVKLRDDRLAEFWTGLDKMNERFPTELDEFKQFLRDWYATIEHRAAIIASHKKAIEKLNEPGGPLYNRRVTEFLAGADAAALKLLAEDVSGFRMSAGDLETVSRQAALVEDADRIERMLASGMVKAKIAKDRREKTTDVNAEMLFEALETDKGAKWFVELTDKSKGLKLQILTLERLRAAAQVAKDLLADKKPGAGVDASLLRDARDVARIADSQLIKEEWANHRKLDVKQATAQDLLEKLTLEEKTEEDEKKWIESASWLVNLLGRITPMEPLGMTVGEVKNVAMARLNESRLAETEASVSQMATKAGFLGFSSRTIWLLVVSFLVCVVGIANAMLMSVTERFREIATMKCLGATDGFIMISFVLESCMQGIAGSAMGLALGFLLGTTRTWAKYGWMAMQSLPGLDILWAGALSVVLGILISALAAVYPAWVAARLAPMEAMRIE